MKTECEMYGEYNIYFAHNYDNKINSNYIKFVKEKKRNCASNEVAGVIFGPFLGIHGHAPTWRCSVAVLSVVFHDHLYSVVHRVIMECRVNCEPNISL